MTIRLPLALLLISATSWAADINPTVEELRKASLRAAIAEQNAHAAEAEAKAAGSTMLGNGAPLGGVGLAIDPVARGQLTLKGVPSGAAVSPGSPNPQTKEPSVEPPRITYLGGIDGESAVVSVYYDGTAYSRLQVGRYFRNYHVDRINLDTLCIDISKAERAKHKGKKGVITTDLMLVPQPQLCAGSGSLVADMKPHEHPAPAAGNGTTAQPVSEEKR